MMKQIEEHPPLSTSEQSQVYDPSREDSIQQLPIPAWGTMFSENALHALITNAPIVFFAINTEGIITFSSGRGLKGLGLASGTLVGVSIFEFYRDVPGGLERIMRALNGEEFTDISRI